MSRIRELIEAAISKYPSDRFFLDFDHSCRINPAKRAIYRTYDDALKVLEQQSWQVLKLKALAHFMDHRPGQLKQGFFNQLNEAFAYRHLVQRGCSEVVMLAESGMRTPDIRYVESCRVKHCEVKTIGLSEAEINRRGSGEGHSNTYSLLDQGLMRKIASSVEAAKAQIATMNTTGLVYLVAVFDDLALDYYPEYRQQVVKFLGDRNMHDVHIKVGLRGNRRIAML